MMSDMKRIVVAEENESLRHLIGMILNYPGHHIISEAESYREALNALQVCPAGLLIMECEINGTSGLDLIRRIRGGAAGCSQRIPIIVLTEPQKDEWMDTYLDSQVMGAGATARVMKPLTMTKLIPAVMDALKREPVEPGRKMHIVTPAGFRQYLSQKLPRFGRMFVPAENLV
jgi:DNA-binding response OmpR family regulator